MYCTSCGTALDAGAKFCPACGVAVDTSTPAGGTAPARALNVPFPIGAQWETWRAPAIAAGAAVAAGVALALLANLFLLISSSHIGFSPAAAIAVVLYGGLGIGSVGSARPSFLDYQAPTIHYSLSFTLLGAFMLLLVILTAAGWIASRTGRQDDRGTAGTAMRTAVVFATVMFIGSFLIHFLGMHPQHITAFVFSFVVAAVCATAGSRIERNGFGFWREPVNSLSDRHPQLVQSLGSGIEALARTLALAAGVSVLALIVLAIEYPHDAGLIVGGGRFISELLLAPLWFPHIVGAVFLAAQGISFHTGVVGSAGDAYSDTTFGSTLSIFGGDHGTHVPAYFALLLLVPLLGGLAGGYKAASRRSGTISQRSRAALGAAAPFVILTWFIAMLVGVKASAGFVVVSGTVEATPATAGAIFWPLVWGPVIYLLGAGVQMWRAGDLAPTLERYKERVATATSAGSTASASADGTLAAATSLGSVSLEHRGARSHRFCSGCGAERPDSKRFCTSCGQKFTD